MKRLKTKKSDKQILISPQGKQHVESRKEEPQTNKENFNRYLKIDSEITPVQERLVQPERQQDSGVLMQREGFLLLPKSMEKGKEPTIFGCGVSVLEAQGCLLELGIHMKVAQVQKTESSNKQITETRSRIEYGIQAYEQEKHSRNKESLSVTNSRKSIEYTHSRSVLVSPKVPKQSIQTPSKRDLTTPKKGILKQSSTGTAS